MSRVLKHIEYLIIIIPIIVAGIQIYLNKADTLSAWRGGGFGMYTEPHPVKSRVAFLINNTNPENNWIRVYPLDERFGRESYSNNSYLSELKQISAVVASRISFPSRIDEDDFLYQVEASAGCSHSGRRGHRADSYRPGRTHPQGHPGLLPRKRV